MILILDYQSKLNEVIHTPKDIEFRTFENLCKAHNLTWAKSGDLYTAGSIEEKKEIILKNQ
jgi:hypothetical protein